MTNKQKSPRKIVGRPTKMTPEIVGKLEYAFLLGKNDVEACAEAKIGKSTLYDFQRKNPEFTHRKTMLRGNANMRVKILISEAIMGGCAKTSRWYLSRRCKKEFSFRL